MYGPQVYLIGCNDLVGRVCYNMMRNYWKFLFSTIKGWGLGAEITWHVARFVGYVTRVYPCQTSINPHYVKYQITNIVNRFQSTWSRCPLIPDDVMMKSWDRHLMCVHCTWIAPPQSLGYIMSMHCACAYKYRHWFPMCSIYKLIIP